MRAIRQSGADSLLLFWSILNHEGARVRSRIVRRWQRLLDDRKAQEEEYHQFLHDNAAWFFSDGINRLVVLSKVRLGANCVTDFVSTYSQLSYGFLYELIEIESPHTVPFTKAGNPSISETRSRDSPNPRLEALARREPRRSQEIVSFSLILNHTARNSCLRYT